jgi:hypothetical protein
MKEGNEKRKEEYEDWKLNLKKENRNWEKQGRIRKLEIGDWKKIIRIEKRKDKNED